MGRYGIGLHTLRNRHPMMTRSRRRREYLDRLLNGGSLHGRRNIIETVDFWRKYVVKRAKANKALDVTDIEFNKEKNKTNHHTERYDTENLVVRRGQPFQITIHFDRKLNEKSDNMNVQLTTGEKPMENKGSVINLRLPDSSSTSKVTEDFFRWKLRRVQQSDKLLTVELTPPPNSIIGAYKFFVETSLKNDDKVSRFEVESEPLYIICNPWCAEDDVYMENEKERDEYVMNETGRIWVGTSNYNRGRPWNYGQFDDPCLEAAIFLLDRAELKEGARRSIVSISRTISAQANSCDDHGVLEGKWSKPYPSNCTKPWAWNGSVNILKEFMRTGNPVKYGQCWVFSGIVTTLMRALGIPTRSITNFQSAHDTDCSMTIDSHFDEDGSPCDDLDDSIWNFHVWNESWFRRGDLPDGYDGWQAYDATPQEVSDQVMRCGPAPLKAIKEGHVYLNYDIPFIFSEVNGDRVFWKVSDDGMMTVSDVESNTVGKCISTKAVGCNDRNDITNLYKYGEGSSNERRVVSYVNKFSTRSNMKIYNDIMTRDVKITINVPVVMIGKDLNVSLKVTNTSSHPRTIDGRISVVSSFYTGLPCKRIQGEKSQHTISPKSDQFIKVPIKASDYTSKLNAESSITLYVSFKVDQTGQQLAKKEPITFAKPDLTIEMEKQLKAREEANVTVIFTNPLPINLTNCEFNFECAGVQTRRQKFVKQIKRGEEMRITTEIWPYSRGKKEMEVTFASDQLCGVDGIFNFTVV